MKSLVIAAALMMGFSGSARGALVEIVNEPHAGIRQAAASVNLLANRSSALPAAPSELPEPEMFAMMLIGLVLIGYRASRDSDEKFE